MGIPTLWDDIKQVKYTQGRQRVNLIDFTLNKNYRIAIDAHHILFECGFYQFEELGKPILNFVKRLKDLVSLNVTFILVFDGVDVPREKNLDRQATIPQFMHKVQQLLQLLQISYVMAPGEGEAQCCCMWKQGQIDYVWSNDSDCLLFGGNKIWRNYSKNIDDLGVTQVNRSNQAKENYITVIDYDQLLEKNNKLLMNRKQLLLYTTLLGGDYHKQGVKGFGPEKSFKLATWNNPNFANKFYDIFAEPIKDYTRITKQYIELQKNIFEYCKFNTAKIFDRNYSNMFKASTDTNNFEDWPNVSVINHYFHPSVNENINLDTQFWNIEENINVSNSMAYKLINFNDLKLFLHKLNLPIFKDFNNWFYTTFHEMFLIRFLINNELESILKCKITEEKADLIKQWKVRYNTFIRQLDNTVELALTRTPRKIFTLSPAKSPLKSPTNAPLKSPTNSPLKSPTKSPLKKLTETPIKSLLRSPEKAPKRSPSKRQLEKQEFINELWIRQDYLNEEHLLVKEYHERELEAMSELKCKNDNKKKNPQSLKKKKYIQNNKIDGFLSRHATPINKNITTLKQLKNSNHFKRIDSIRKNLFFNDDGIDIDDGIDSNIIGGLFTHRIDSHGTSKPVNIQLNTSGIDFNQTRKPSNWPRLNEVFPYDTDDSVIILKENQLRGNKQNSKDGNNKINKNNNVINLISSSPLKNIRSSFSRQSSSVGDKSVEVTKPVNISKSLKNTTHPNLKNSNGPIDNLFRLSRESSNLKDDAKASTSRDSSILNYEKSSMSIVNISSNAMPTLSRQSSMINNIAGIPQSIRSPKKVNSDVHESTTPCREETEEFSLTRETSILDQITNDMEEYMNNSADEYISA